MNQIPSEDKCEFELEDGSCGALACFSSEKCGARDKDGNPKYNTKQPGSRRPQVKEGGNERDL